MLDNRKVIIDEELKLADTGGSTAVIYDSAAGTVDGVGKYYDTGGGYTEGLFVVDIETITFATGASNYKTIDICLEGSSAESSADYVPLARILCGIAATSADDRTDIVHATWACITAGRYIIPFHNDFGGTIYRYLRVYTTFLTATAEASGSATLAFKAYLSKR
jgi:hypothetical protein